MPPRRLRREPPAPQLDLAPKEPAANQQICARACLAHPCAGLATLHVHGERDRSRDDDAAANNNEDAEKEPGDKMLGLCDIDFGVGFGFALNTTGTPKESKPDIGAKTKNKTS